MINLRQFKISDSKTRIGRQVLALTLASSLSLPHAWAQQKPDADEGKMYAVVPVSTAKDKKTKTLHFKLENRDGETIDMEFQSDPNEQKSFSVMRREMTEQVEEMKRFTNFVKSHLGLPDDFYRAYVDSTHANKLAVAPDIAKDVNNYFILEYYNSLPLHYQNEIRRLYELTRKSTGQIAKETALRPFSTTIHGFPTQSVLFSAVIGAMMWDQLRADYAANPMAMIQHLEHMKDPIGHLSFYAFMAANGFSTDMLNRGLAAKAPSKAVKGMRAAIPYLGMSAGMIASNLTHEVATLVRACAATVLGGGNEVQQMMTKLAKMSGHKDPCDEAMSEFFNFENKVEQYIPMLVSMALSTGGATFLQIGVVKGSQYTAAKVMGAVDKLEQRVNSGPLTTETRIGYNGAASSAQKWTSALSARNAFNYSRSAGSRATKFIGFVLRATPLPTSWFFHSLTVGAVLSNVASTYLFLKFDGIMIPWLTKTWAQIWRASGVDNVDEDIRKSFEFNQKKKWMLDSADRGCANANLNARSSDCHGNILKYLKDFRNQMDKWRLQNHARFFNGVQIWTMMMNNMVRGVWGAESFYKYYVEQVFLSLKIGQRLKTEKDPKGVELQKVKYLPFRKTQLFGIKPLGHEVCTGKNKDVCVTEAKLYLDHPDDMIKYQRNRLYFVANQLAKPFGLEEKPLPFMSPTLQKAQEELDQAEALDKDNKDGKEMRWENEADAVNLEKAKKAVNEINKDALAFIKQLITDMQSSDLDVVGKAMIRLKQALQNDKWNDQNAYVTLAAIYKMLGSPQPIMEQGIAVPYIYHENEKENLKGFETPSGYGYKFERPVEYFLYQMLCGPDEKTGKVMDNIKLFGVDMTPPEFKAPRIVPQTYIEVELPNRYMQPGEIRRAQLCYPGKVVPFSALYYAKIFVNGSDKPTTFFNYLNTNIKPDALGDWSNLKRESKTYVYSWWDTAVTTSIRNTFGKLDVEFQKLLVDLADGIKNHIEYDFDASGAPTERKQLKATDASRSLLYSNLQELNVYMSILADLEGAITNGQGTVQLPKSANNRILKELDYNPVAQIESQKEFTDKLNEVVKLLQAVKVEGSDDNRRVVLPSTEKSLRKIQVEATEALELYRKHVEALKFKSNYQKDVVAITLDGLNKCLVELTGYLLNIQLTNYAAITTFDEYLKSNANEGQKKAPVKTSSSPMGK